MTQQEKQAAQARIDELIAKGSLSPEEQVELDQAQTALLMNQDNGSTAVPSGTSLPKSFDISGIIDDVTDPIAMVVKGERMLNSLGKARNFRLLTVTSNEGNSHRFPIDCAADGGAPGFFERNAERLKIGTECTLTLEQTIEGKTHWVDRSTGAISVHKTTNERIIGVKFANKVDADIAYRQKLIAKLAPVAEARINAYKDEPAMANAMAVLYQSVLKK